MNDNDNSLATIPYARLEFVDAFEYDQYAERKAMK
jgi:hypothetical protein